MADSGFVSDPDRLPWLTEERKPRRKLGLAPLLLVALAAALLVAGVSYWLGLRSGAEPDAATVSSSRAAPAATVKLPRPMPAEPRAEAVEPAPIRDVLPVTEPEVRIERPAETARVTRTRSLRRLGDGPRPRPRVVIHRSHPSAAAAPKPAPKPAPVARPQPLQPWPAAVSEGAYGRMVRIGTFSSRRQAKLAWWKLVRHYPGMKRLRAVVAPVQSLRNGRFYYRLQFGTTSQAHSEVLCQRMRFIAQSCVVVGLPAARGARG